MGRPVPPVEVLRGFVGPPLAESFAVVCQLPPDEIPRAVTLFREYFAQRGMYENTVYPGIPQLLQRLRAGGRRLYVATNKLEVFAQQILEHFDLAQYFVQIAGSDRDRPGQTKADVIGKVLAGSSVAPQSAVMIGDRHHDIDGAHAHGMPAIAVLYGYGSKAELAAADCFASDVSSLISLLLQS